LSGGGNSLSLRTNTTGNPNFTTFAGPTGLVSADWRANGLFTQSSSGTNEFSFPGFTHRTHGNSTSASANATGSIVGMAIAPNSAADIGTIHEMTIDFIRTPTATGGRCVAPPDGLRAWWPGDGDTRDLIGRNHANGNFNVFVMGASGSRPTQLTDVPGYNARPNWSHDGRRITFTACRVTDFSCEIYVMNADGSGQTKLTDDFSADYMSEWSPDDRRIVFVSERDGSPQIYVMNADGSNLTRLTHSGAVDQEPTWSPDGTRIAFQTNRDGNNEVYVINADGSNPTNLTQSPAADELPAWSPGGDEIAFQSERDGNLEIYVMNVDGSQPTRLTNNPAVEYYPAWSPTGSRIAFVSNRDGNFEIYVMRPDGSVQQRVTNDPAWDADPAWATDQLLAIASAQATFAPAKVREGFSFERAGQGGFAFGAGIDDLQQLTIDAWVKHNSLPFGRIQRYVTLPDEKAVLRYDGVSGFAQLHFYMRINGELQHIRVDNVLQAGVFHHVAGSYDGSIMRLYLDGVEVGSLAVPGALNSGLGVLFSSGDETLDGVLDEIDIFGRALDAAEVRVIFEAGKAGKCKNAPAT
jgi:Tol biopolymer transport system component